MLNSLLCHQITLSTALDRAVCGQVGVESRDETLVMRIWYDVRGVRLIDAAPGLNLMRDVDNDETTTKKKT